MSSQSQAQAKFREDYQAPRFRIETVDLSFRLEATATRVTNRMQLQRLAAGPLELDGEQLQLESVAIDGRELDASQYEVSPSKLVIADVPEHCELTIVTQINPSTNTALEGLYLAADSFCTQCEAEGFRRITYYLDRPDVLAIFTTTIHAPQQYPYLLSNGDKVDAGSDSDGWHWVTWHDPHPKPAYLFALVAGDFDRLEDTFITRSGRQVSLELYVDRGNSSRGTYAMESLQRAMRWDEERFELEYDLDTYMIVAVDFFNMGAMENKGLNVFNSRYVLADQATATDTDFVNIEAVIGHEYFHNWTGNRITCRDWFQLSLKEGLTVFRDQEFSSDLGSRAIHRIQAIRTIRGRQFAEDASPMAHPIRPDKVVEMNNFYTVTVYDKGAEVIRMLHTLLGEAGFQQGMKLYVERHDGQAVTCEDFIAAMEDANDYDLQQFRRWYSQAGTPEVVARLNYSKTNKTATLKLTQSTPATPGQKHKQPMVIPIRLSAYSKAGRKLALQSNDACTGSESEGYLYTLTSETADLVFTDVLEEPIFAMLEDFSAPVRFDYPQTSAELTVLMAAADSEVTRWEASQKLFTQYILTAVRKNTDIALDLQTVAALQEFLAADIDPALQALVLQPPELEELAEHFDVAIPLEALDRARRQLIQQIAASLAPQFERLVDNYRARQPRYTIASDAIAERALVNLAHYYLALHEPRQFGPWVIEHFERADNMTVQNSALNSLIQLNLEGREDCCQKFSQQWRETPLALDKWFAAEASSPQPDTVERVTALLAHPGFSLQNPNRVYALIASFSRNMLQFHRADGAGYALVADVIQRLNTSNPQVAARLITPFLSWRRFDSDRQQQMKQHLEILSKLPQLARDLDEKISNSLAA
ncbi:aminopeptidase N [Pseudidiomarina aestuarii]|uniref:Aminopeptidase N n=1 Tax=Pseudidiomarina aestuarii TaxID=624146 RepID=A0A7Z6ZTH9_9GAMM|nr:aminopeptidase N [Pseudidiomarina aestuarii]RUO41074.1 aminopeptidase N [Pseudidiomarina aestuarii]